MLRRSIMFIALFPMKVYALQRSAMCFGDSNHMSLLTERKENSDRGL